MLNIANIEACEGSTVTVMGIKDAILNADITSTCIKVHMRLIRVVTDLHGNINAKHARFVEERSTSVVVLENALYGRIEAVVL